MRLAAFQRHPIHDDVAAAGESLLRDLRWCDAEGVDLAIFPECYLHGHAYDQATIERRALRGDSMEMRRLLAALVPIKAAAIIGFFERRDDGLYNSAAVVEAGIMAGLYAKAHPNEEAVMAGQDFSVFALQGRIFGVNICNDANHAEPAQRLAAQGAALLCYPLNNLLRPAVAEAWRHRSLENLQARARQTGCRVASADVTGRREGRLAIGCTVILRPDGSIATRVEEMAEGVAVYDLPASIEMSV